jgi:hypothetical protein
MTAYNGNKEDNRYKCWISMKQRCDNPRDKKFPNYGGRGISYDATWSDFKTFCEAAGPRPEGTSLDRFPNNDGNYEKGNVRWATPTEQANNRRPREPKIAQVNNSTGILGVCLIGNGLYRAQAKVAGINSILYEGPSFDSAVTARRTWESINRSR